MGGVQGAAADPIHAGGIFAAIAPDHIAEMQARAEQRSDDEPEVPVPSEPMFPEDDIERWGFIAHELQETLVPSAATATKDAPVRSNRPIRGRFWRP